MEVKKGMMIENRNRAAIRTRLVCAVCLLYLLLFPATVMARTAGNGETGQKTEQSAEQPVERIRKTGSEKAAVQIRERISDAAEQAEEEREERRKAEEAAYLAAHPGIGRTVVLDPGHSGVVAAGTVPLGPGSSQRKAADASGTRGRASGLAEYQLTMSICQQLRKALEDEGYTVILTHETNDVPIDCVKRAQVANEAHADIFVRIHANGSDNSGVSGAMTICITPGNPYYPGQYAASRKLSEILLDTYCAETDIQKQYVWETDSMTGNNWSEVPCTILEMGYMTNKYEDLRMADPEFQKTMVSAILHGIDKYFQKAE